MDLSWKKVSVSPESESTRASLVEKDEVFLKRKESMEMLGSFGIST